MNRNLNNKENRYKTIFELSPEAIVILDIEGNIIDINGRVYDWLGYKPEEVIGKNIFSVPFLDKENKIRVKENFTLRISGKQVDPYELEFITKDGKKVIGRVMGTPFYCDEKILCVIIMISDITKNKEIEKSLKESEEKYRRLIELAQEGVWLIDEKAVTTFVNPRMVEMLGYKEEKEMIGRHLFSFMDEQEVEIAKQNLERRKKGIKEQHDFEFFKKDGSKIYTSLETSPIMDKNGKYLGALAVVADITQRREMELKIKESEEKYRNIITSSPDAITIADLNGKIIDCNQATLDLHGFSKKTELIGKDAFTFIARKDWPRASDNMKKTMEQGFIKNVEYTMITKDGREFPGELSASFVKDPSGKPVFFMAITKDISERKKTEQAKTEFVSLASHQLRTPLTTINWYVEMLLGGRFGSFKKEQKEYLEEIYAANQQLIKLVNLLLNVSRIELGTLKIKPKRIDVSKVADREIKELLPMIKNKNLKIKKDYIKNLPLVNADPDIMVIIIQNLLNNAINYTPKNGRINLLIEKQEDNILIKISDTGYGIPDDQKSRIFEKFFRADNVAEKEPEGTGLGLYIVKSVIEQSGGRVWFESKENRGTTFFVKVPFN